MSAVAAEPLAAGPESSEVETLHRRLTRRGQQRLRPVLTPELTSASLAAELSDRHAEEDFVAAERAAVAPLLRDVPADADGFVEWFEDLRRTGPGQGDALFPWLATSASLDEMRWFLGQELAGEAGFEDLLALTQLRMPIGPKLEMARNYWDEVGRGRASGMHGPMLEHLATALSVALPFDQIVWQSLALANLMVALAWNRHYAFQSVGALGVIELTAPGRAEHVNAGLRRLGVEPGVRQYFALHATLDIQHSRDWNREIVRPLVAAEPRCAVAIAEGALLRLRAGARCFATYRTHLGVALSGAADLIASRVSAGAPRPA
jgi:Iron-containing redox enzyme